MKYMGSKNRIAKHIFNQLFLKKIEKKINICRAICWRCKYD